LMAIELKNSDAMCELGMFYEDSYYSSFDKICNRNYDEMEKYYLMAIKLDNSEAMRHLGNYYSYECCKNNDILNANNIEKKNKINIENKKKGLKYHIQAAKLNNIYSIIKLCNYYSENHKYKKMIEYCLLGIEVNKEVKIKFAHFVRMLGKYYREKKDYINMIKYYTLAIDFEDSESMFELGDYYQDLNDDENMVKYFALSVEFGGQNFDDSAYELVKYYKHKKDFENMAKYYTIIFQYADHYNDVAAFNLWRYYRSKKDTSNEFKYFIYYVKLSDYLNAFKKYISNVGIYSTLSDVLNKIISNDFDEYINYIKYGFVMEDHETKDYDEIMSSPEEPEENLSDFTDKILKYIKEYKEKTSVIEYLANKKIHKIYLNKLNTATEKNIIDECCICYENNLQMSIGKCCHTVCTTCYPKIKKCPMCNGKIC